MGNILKDLGNLKEAKKYYYKAIEIRPDLAETNYNISFLLLKEKKFKEGFNKYEWRFKCKNKKDLMPSKISIKKPEWNPNNKVRVLLWDEQGIGDKISFASLIPELLEKVDQLIVKVDERLIPLFKRSFDQRIIYIKNIESINIESFDSHIAMGSLLKFLRKSEEDFKKSKNYIKVNERESNIFKDKLKDNYHEKIIGISWKSKTTLDKGSNLSLERFILGIYSPKIKFLCLQYGDVEQEITQLRKKTWNKN